MGLSNTILPKGFSLFWCLSFAVIWFWSTIAWGGTASIITTVAGNGKKSNAGYNIGNGIAATNANLTPSGIAVDSNSNIYIADSANHRILKVNATTGVGTNFVGDGTSGYNGDNIPAINAKLNNPQGIALDSDNNLYISDVDNYRIRKVETATGNIITVAGNGTFGFSGDNSPATGAQLNKADSIALDNSGNLYIADVQNFRIRKVEAATGTITTIAGKGYTTYTAGSEIRRGYNPADEGVNATSSALGLTGAIAVDSANNVYIADNDSSIIRRIDATSKKITRIVGNGTDGYSGDDAAATSAQLAAADGIAVDNAGNLYIADVLNQRIRRFDSNSKNISTVAGNGLSGYGGDGGVAIKAQLNYPSDVALSHDGNYLYIVDTDNYRIRKVALTQGLSQPNLTVTPLMMPLNKNTPQTLKFTLTNAASSSVPVNLGALNISGYYADQFTVSNAGPNDCTNMTLNPGSSCAVAISYTPDATQSLPNTMTILNVPDTRGIIHAQALITTGEDAAGEASRRIPDVLSDLNIPTLQVGVPKTITWTISGYQTDTHSQIALFECATDGAGNAVNDCGNVFSTNTAKSTVLNATTVVDGIWAYLGIFIKNRTYSYTYTPTKAGPVVLRFYQKSGLDKDAGKAGLSLLIPGGLNGAGSSFTHFDAEGRRIKATVQP